MRYSIILTDEQKYKFIDKVYVECKKRKLSLRQLAFNIGVNQATIYMYSKDPSKLSRFMTARLIDYFGWNAREWVNE